jgi:cysteine desulfurase
LENIGERRLYSKKTQTSIKPVDPALANTYNQPMNEIYLDHASTTYTNPEVLKAMLPYFSETYGNSESRHSQGQQSRIALDQARESVAKIFNCKASEVIFTGSATEANNLAILGIARANKEKGLHIISTTIEHSSISAPLAQLEKEGFKITLLTPDSQGLISPADLEAAIQENTILTSIIYAHNEFGTIQDISALGTICQKKNILFHTDACQAAGALTLNTKDLNLDLMTINGSKIYGPKGVAALYIKDRTPIQALTYGGPQEKGLSPGTTNTPGVVGLAKALELSQEKRETESARLTILRDKLITSLLEKIPHSYINGHPTKRLPNNISLSIPGTSGDELILHLDAVGIYISTGSACDTGKNTPSNSLKSLGLSNEDIIATIRLTLGQRSCDEHINYAASKIPEIVLQMR